MRHWRLSVFLGLTVVFCLAFAVREWQLLPDGQTHIITLDIGQGDSTLIVTASGKQILIDGGRDWSTLEKLGTYMPFFDRSIDLLVLTHPDFDHLASFPEILLRYNVTALAISDVAIEAPWFRRIIAAANARGTQVLPLYAGQTVSLEAPLEFAVLWPPKNLPETYAKASNDTSLVMKLRDGKHTILFMGDAEERVETTLVLGKANLASDILKVPHHGSKTSSTTGLLLAVSPKRAIVSVGENTYGHPNAGVLKRYEELGIPVDRTDMLGDIEVVWGGGVSSNWLLAVGSWLVSNWLVAIFNVQFSRLRPTDA